MIGIFSFLCAAKGLEVLPLADIILPYSGDPMGPFSESDASLPFVADMLAGTKGMFAGIGNN